MLKRLTLPFGVRMIILMQLLAMVIFGGAVTAVYGYDVADVLGLLPEQEIYRFLNLLLDLSGLIIIFGLVWMRRWAWLMLLTRLSLDMLMELGLYLNGDPQYLSMLINIITIFYLVQGDVRHAFEKREKLA